MSRPITPHPVNPARPRPLPPPRPNPPTPRPQPRPGRVAYVAVLASVALATGALGGLMAWLAGGGWIA